MTYAAETNRIGTGSIILYFKTLRRECRSARKAKRHEIYLHIERYRHHEFVKQQIIKTIPDAQEISGILYHVNRRTSSQEKFHPVKRPLAFAFDFDAEQKYSNNQTHDRAKEICG